MGRCNQRYKNSRDILNAYISPEQEIACADQQEVYRECQQAKRRSKNAPGAEVLRGFRLCRVEDKVDHLPDLIFFRPIAGGGPVGNYAVAGGRDFEFRVIDGDAFLVAVFVQLYDFAHGSFRLSCKVQFTLEFFYACY